MEPLISGRYVRSIYVSRKTGRLDYRASYKSVLKSRPSIIARSRRVKSLSTHIKPKEICGRKRDERRKRSYIEIKTTSRSRCSTSPLRTLPQTSMTKHPILVLTACLVRNTLIHQFLMRPVCIHSTICTIQSSLSAYHPAWCPSVKEKKM